MTLLDFANQNLQDHSFNGRNLTGANLSGADLRGCDFTGAILTGANLQWVKTGQSPRQTRTLMVSAIAGPVILVGLSFALVWAIAAVLPEPMTKVLFGALPFLAAIAEIFFRDSITARAPRVTAFFGMAALGVLVGMMAIVTGGLLLASITSFGDGGGAMGLILLVLVGVAAMVTARVFTWLQQSIQQHPGTSFKQANLTEADFSHAEIENTDFTDAILTGVCIDHWTVNAATQFTNLTCDYLYLDSAQQNRFPDTGTFAAGEAERFLSKR